jgi:hypothetical protein
MVENNCPCGDKECNKKESSPGLEIKSSPFISNREYNMLHKRLFFEKWLDQYNHIMEFSRTFIQLAGFILQLIILYKLFL